jgi:serine protease Do
MEEGMKIVTLNGKWRVLLRVVLGAALVLVMPGAPARLQAKTNPPPKLLIQDAPLNREARAPISFASVIKKVEPSVVNIYSTMLIKERPSPLLNDPFLRRFFGEQFGDQRQPRERKAESLGSGVIVSPDGYILTANHVVEGAEAVKVALASGEREYDAKIIGTDPPTDVAVLKIDTPKKLPAIAIADSDKLEVGDIVLALGNPFAVGRTVTMGIVSAVGRGGLGMVGYENFIQTDAAINPGNSGGGLVDAEGRLVGINTLIVSRTGGFQGVGFAVPINIARYVMERLVQFGKVTRGFLGINIQPVTPELAKEFHLPEDAGGVLVGGVSPNGPAAQAGLKEGDDIIELNGKKVTGPDNLRLVVAQTSPGSRVVLRVLRSENSGPPVEKTFSVTLAELPQEALAAQSRRGGAPGNQPGNMDALDGVEVADIDRTARRRFAIPPNVQGALVVNVDENSSAAEAGLRPGDVLLEIGRQPVQNAEGAVALSEKAKSDQVLLLVWSQGPSGQNGTRYIVVENPKHK